MSLNLTMHAASADFAPARTPTAATATPSLFARVLDVLRSARLRRSEADIAAFLESHGGVLTDDLERQISRRFGHMVG